MRDDRWAQRASLLTLCGPRRRAADGPVAMTGSNDMAAVRFVRALVALAAALVWVPAIAQRGDRLDDAVGAPVFDGENPVDASSPRVTAVAPGASPTGNAGVSVLKIDFSEAVSIPSSAVVVWTTSRGVLPPPFIVPISPSSAFVVLAEAVRDDRVTVILDSTITDIAGNPLDGEVAQPAAPVLPSGDGLPGGPAVFRFNVLQGDADASGVVNDADGAAVVASIGRRRGQAGFDARADLNGDGVVNVLDVAVFRAALGRSLPPTDGVAPMVMSTTPGSEGFGDELGQVTITFSERISPQRFFNARTLAMVDVVSNRVYTPRTATLSSNRQTATYFFAPPLPGCVAYRLQVSNAISDTSSELLGPGQAPLISGLLPPTAPRWAPGFAAPGIDGTVSQLISYDEDGGGPNPPTLVAGGSFTWASSRPVRNIARWHPWTQSWSSVGLSGENELDGPVWALVEYDDDGAGPNPPVLVAGGEFTTAFGVSTRSIARWNPRTGAWSAFGSGSSNGMNGPVYALAVHDADGAGPERPALIAAGAFTEAGPAGGINRIASWNPAMSRWERLGNGISGSVDGAVLALRVFDEDGEGPSPAALIAGGRFSLAGNVSVTNIARWNFQTGSWSAVGAGAGDAGRSVRALTDYDDDGAGPNAPMLVAAGSFTTIGGVEANCVARWNPATGAWSSFGEGDANGITEGLDAAPLVSAIGVYDADGPGPVPPTLVAGGTFRKAGAVRVNSIARWDPSINAWTRMLDGIQISSLWGRVGGMTLYDADGAGPNPPALVVGGAMTHASFVPARGVARWELAGERWSAIPEPGAQAAGGIVLGMTSTDLDGDGPAGRVVVAGGSFTEAGGIRARSLAAFDPHTRMWSDLAVPGFHVCVVAVAAYDEDGDGPEPETLVAGGRDTEGWGGPAQLRRRDPRTGAWDEMGLFDGVHLGSNIEDLVVYDSDDDGEHPPELVVAGVFALVDGVQARSVARWNPVTRAWSSFGEGITRDSNAGHVLALASYDDDGVGPSPTMLVVGGSFTAAGGVAANGIARWNPVTAAWSSFGDETSNGVLGGSNGGVRSLAVYDPDADGPNRPMLVAGGVFTTAGGVPASNLAMWNPATGAWSGMSIVDTTSSGVSVESLLVFDDDGPGQSPARLLVGGRFTRTGPIEARAVAAWNGLTDAWAPLASGVGNSVTPSETSRVYAMVPYEDPTGSRRLFVGGSLWIAGSRSSTIAEWSGVASCPIEPVGAPEADPPRASVRGAGAAGVSANHDDRRTVK